MEGNETGIPNKRKLKDPRTLRVFFSSPFGGMEEEREEFARKYFPHFHHKCNARGIQFVPVDMRWGITSEAADNAQVVNICLREIDRSDIFIGFFGQRYGWHGESDELLQQNFDNAMGRYPWLARFRDKGVTEVEFLHGHLNHPGQLPACICFRDKHYDDDMKEKAMTSGDTKSVFKYSAESEHSAKYMEDLIRRVKETESECLGLLLNYKNPPEGAKFMFESVWEYCLDLLTDSDVSEMSSLQQNRLCHDAYIASRTTFCLGISGYIEELEQAQLKDTPHILVRGPSGCGKSALLANFVKKVQTSNDNVAVIYHFIGCAQGTTDPQSIMQHILSELQVMNGGGANKEEKSESHHPAGEEIQSNKFHDIYVNVQNNMEQASSAGKKIIIILDGLDKVTASTKTAKHVYWLPEKFPVGINLIVSTLSLDNDTYELLIKDREFYDLEILPLAQDTKEEICKQVLLMNGKELSPKQLKRIVEAQQTENPLFLKIVLSEISIYGYFRLLDDKIDSLIYSDGVKNLLIKVLQRLEEDYSVPDHPAPLVKQVLSAIAVSHQGLSETELLDMFNIASHIWSPFYFAMENFLINDAGLFRFAFSELEQAIEERYLNSAEERTKVICQLIEYFHKVLMDDLQPVVYSNMKIKRVARELPWLQKDINDKHGLIQTLSNLKIFYALCRISVYELIDLWAVTGCSQDEICDLLMSSFNLAVADIYIYQQKNILADAEPPGYVLLPVLYCMQDVFSVSCYHRALVQVLQRAVKILEGIEGKVPENERQQTLRDYRYHLACAFVNNSEYKKAQVMHETVMQECRSLLEDSEDMRLKQTLAYTCNGLGVLHLKQKHYKEAQSFLQESIKLHTAIGNNLCVAEATMNIGIIKLENNQAEIALEFFEKAKKTFELIYFGHMPVLVGNLLTNMALCYRRMNDAEKAENLYLRSLKVKANAVGWQNEVIATCYMNLGSLEFYLRKNYAKAEEYTKKAIEILEFNEVKLEQNEMWQAQENLVLMLICQSKWDEALPIFRYVFAMLERENKVEQGAASVHRQIMRYMISKGLFEEATAVAVCHVNSPKLRTPTAYILLDHCDRQLEKRPTRLREQTLTYAIEELWRGNNELTDYVVQNYVLPFDDVDLLMKMIRTMDELNPSFQWTSYKVGAIWCQNLNKLDAAVVVLKEGLNTYPNAIELKSRLFDVYRQLHCYQEAYFLLKEVVEHESENQAIVLVAGQVAFCCKDIELCIELWEKAAQMPDKALAEKAKNALSQLKAAIDEESSKDTNPEDSEG